MTEQKIERMNRYFEEKISLCEEQRKRLVAEERGDEAVFEKIRANVYDIFRTVFSVAVQTCKEDGEALKCFFDKRLEQIPTSWVAAYEKAKQHDHTVNMQIEKIKLDTIDEIRDTFEAVWREAK